MSLKAAINVFKNSIKISASYPSASGKVKLFTALLLRQILGSRTGRLIPKKLKLFMRKTYYHIGRMDEYIIKDGIKYYVCDAESYIILNDNFEKEVWRYLTLRKGDIFIDVGAHVGKYTLPAAKIVGNTGKVIAIEPDPANFEALKKVFTKTN